MISEGIKPLQRLGQPAEFNYAIQNQFQAIGTFWNYTTDSFRLNRFLFKYKGLQLVPWQCQAILLGCLRASSTLRTNFLKMACCLLMHSKKHRLICHIDELSHVGKGSDQLLYVLLTVLGEKNLFSIWAAKYFSQELSYFHRGYLSFFLYHCLSSV